ncbi:hypothetical protein JW879_09440 [candidate division WOR-3 bacterium]|nr:hypothetical protein [candidate division WOR-3 bacterium]
MFKKILIVLMIGCFLLGMATRAEAEKAVGGTATTELEKVAANDENEGVENYVKKVIVEADWGDGPGEFGMDLQHNPPNGPGPLALDKKGILYIYNIGKKKVYKFDKKGEFLGSINAQVGNNVLMVKNNVLFTVKGEWSTGKMVEKVLALDPVTGKVTAEAVLKREGGNTALNGTMYISNEGENLFLITNGDKIALSKEDAEIKIRRVDRAFTVEEKVESLQGGRQRLRVDLSSKRMLVKVDSVKNKSDDIWGYDFLGSDERRNLYIIRKGLILKFSEDGSLKAKINLPTENSVGEMSILNRTFVAPEGNIYYLYPTGRIVQEGWELKFIPGKVQIIKWEL